jgi:hypothetical protein
MKRIAFINLIVDASKAKGALPANITGGSTSTTKTHPSCT